MTSPFILFRDDVAGHELLFDHPRELLVADTRQERRTQAETRGADRDIGRAATDRLGERGDILQPRADLLAV